MTPSRLSIAALLLVLAASACETERQSAPPGTAESAQIDHEAVPPVDLSKHSVPLRDIVFDTFDGDFVRLTIAPPEVRLRLMDRIAPIYEPGFGPPNGLPWLRDTDLVVGYASSRGAYAFPIEVLNSRELVNAELDGDPILVSYCPLCASAVVYSRELDGRTLLFGNTSALYESDLVMFDHQTGSYWFQVAGEAIVGTLTGKRLRPLPSSTTTWGDWKRLHPRTRLLVSDEGERFEKRFYSTDAFAGYPEFLEDGNFAFPVSRERLDDRLRVTEIVVAVEANGDRKAYPPRLLGDAAVNDSVGGRAVVVFSHAEPPWAAAFAAEANGRRLTFAREAGSFVDRETGSTWTAAGTAVAGPLQGTQLEPLSTRRAFWFSLALAERQIELYLPR